MNNFRNLIILLILFVSIPTIGLGYHVLIDFTPSLNFKSRKWKQLPVDFRIDPGTLGGKDGKEMMERACSEWNNVGTAQTLCGELADGQEDITADNFFSIISSDDGINHIVFDETGEIIKLFGSPRNVLGIGLTMINLLTGEIIDATMILNGSIPSSAISDQLSTATHELGHVWGMAHTPIGGINTVNSTPGLEAIDPSAIPTMYPFNNPIDDAFGTSLEVDDKAGISSRYPAN